MPSRLLFGILVTTSLSISVFFGCSAMPQQNTYGGKAILEQTDLFVAGQDGYHTFRIPSLIVTKKGAVLAFCEGRKNSRSDTGDIDILLRRSTDGGRTWSPTKVIVDDGPNTAGNPCPVVDRNTGVVHLLLTFNLGEDNEKAIQARTAKGTRTVWISRSEDDGVTWSKPADITTMAKKPEWAWYATGPGCGIQLTSGRLVVPCDHSVAPPQIAWRSHVIYSDDHGKTWQIGGVIEKQTNECQIVELTNGDLMLNMRNHADKKDGTYHRAVAISRDRGQTFSAVSYDPALIEPVCQASLFRYSTKPPGSKNRLLFANPADKKRVNMTVRLSYDEGRTWPVARPLHEGPTAYSALAVLPDKTIACLYERGDKGPYEKITFARLSLEWLTNGADSP